MKNTGSSHALRASFITVSFVVGLALFGLGAKVRWIDGVKTGEDAVYWAVGVVVLFFTGVAAARARTAMVDWLVLHPLVFRFWLASSSLATILFGAFLVLLAGAGIGDELSEKRIYIMGTVLLVLLGLIGLGVITWGLSEARAVFRPVRQAALRKSAL